MKFSANEDRITMVRDWAIAGDDVDCELVGTHTFAFGLFLNPAGRLVVVIERR